MVEATKVANRDIYDVTYDKGNGEGLITARFHNQSDGDKSEYKGVNDGSFIVTVATGYTGADDVTIEAEDGTVLDTGVINFG